MLKNQNRLYPLLFILFIVPFTGFCQFDSVQVYHTYSYSDWELDPYGLRNRNETHFDSAGNITSVLTELWTGYKFEPEGRTLYTYTASGLLSEKLFQDYFSENWVNYYREINYYNASNLPDSSFYQTWQLSGWINNSHTYYEYDVNNFLVFLEDGYRYYHYPDANGLDTLVLMQINLTGTWTDWSKLRTVYNAQNKPSYSLNYSSPLPGQWLAIDSTSYSYYPNDSLFERKTYTFDSTFTYLSRLDSLVYLNDTTFTYFRNYSQSGASSLFRNVNFQGSNEYNFYSSINEVFDGSTWYGSEINKCTFDSTAMTAHFENRFGSGEYDKILTFDPDGHLMHEHFSSISQHGFYHYGNKPYYYYLTYGNDEICPSGFDSLWIAPGMNTYSWTNGGNTQVKQISTAGTYYCNIVNQFGHYFQSEPKVVQQSFIPSISNSADSSFFVCTAGLFELKSLDIPLYSYQWFRNDTLMQGANSPTLQFANRSHHQQINGLYNLVVSNQCGIDTSSTTHLQFSQPPVRIVPEGNTVICPDDTLIQTASSGYVSYQWNLGESTPTAKSYYGHFNKWVEATDSFGCVSRFNVNVTASINPLYVNPDIYQSQDTILQSVGLYNGSFQWYLNGDSISGATNNKLSINQSGFYSYSYSNGTCQVFSVEKFYNYSTFRIVFTQDTLKLCVGQPYNYLINYYKISGTASALQYHWSPSTGLSDPFIAAPVLTPQVSTNYILTIIDSTGAVRSDTIHILVKSPVQLQLTSSSDKVCASANGNEYFDTLTVTNAGSGTFYWYNNGYPYNGAGSPTIRYIHEPGQYWVNYIDGCQNTSDTVTIGTFQQIPVPQIQPVSIPANRCDIDSIQLFASLPQPEDYTYQWRNGTSLEYFTGSEDTVTVFHTGYYYLTVTDSNGCRQFGEINLGTFTPDTSVSVELNLNGLVNACSGDTVMLAATPYQGWNYRWYNYENLLSGSQWNYPAHESGLYRMLTDNGFGCHGKDSVYLSFGPGPMNIRLVYDSNDIRAHTDILVSSWQWYLNDSLIHGADKNYIHPIAPGWYKAIPSGNYSCEVIPDSILISCTINSSSTATSCYQACDGGIFLTAQGTGPFSFLWPNGDTLSQKTSLCSSIYFVMMTDASGCIASDSISVYSPQAMQILFNIHKPLCFQSCDGALQSLVTGGTSPYVYTWSDGSTGSDLNNICSGTYQLSVTDTNGCTVNKSQYVSQPARINIQTNVQHASCVSCNDGSAQVSISGGSPPYSLLWSDGDTNLSISGKLPGTYVFCITDVNQCQECDSLVIGFDVNIEEMQSGEIKVWPNPFTDLISIDRTVIRSTERLFLTLRGPLGNVLLKHNCENQTEHINATDLSEGIYFLEVRDRNNSLQANFRLIKLH